MGFFTDIFNNLNDEEKESFYKTVIMNDTSDYAANARVEYYRTKLKFMGENVKINNFYLKIYDSLRRILHSVKLCLKLPRKCQYLQ